MKLKHLYSITLLLFSFHYSHAQLTFQAGNPTAAQLVQKIVGSPQVYTNNISYTGANVAKGIFNCTGNCNLGIGTGVLITSGSVNNAKGPNNSFSQSTANLTPSDPDLNTLIATPGGQDAAILEFDFMVPKDSISFKYVWGSEEYNDYVNTGCNDAFGFFVNGPGIIGKKNIALIPGTNTAIAISNVNNGQSPAGVASSGPCNNCQYFVDNLGSPSLQYDGLTTVLTAGTRVCPCEVYHLKMGVQDFCDPNFDSGVFLEGGSFSPTGEIPTYTINNQPLATGDTLYICPGDSVALQLLGCRAPLWATGDTTNILYVTQPGVYYGTFSNNFLLPNGQYALCFATSTIVWVEFLPTNATVTITANSSGGSPTSNVICQGDSVTLTASLGTSYLWSNGATTQSIVVSAPGNYSCTVTFNSSSCLATSLPVTIVAGGTPAVITAASATTFCQGGSVTLNADPAPNYSWSNGAVTSSINVNSTGTYTLTVTDNGCTSETSITVTVNNNPTPTITGNLNVCQGQNANLNAGVYNAYSWSNGAITSSISTSTIGTYTVTVTDANGCTGVDDVTIAAYNSPVPVITGTLAFCSGLQTVINTTNTFSQYNWSNGTTTQNNAITSGGTYTITVTDINGCTGSTSAIITENAKPTATISGITAICSGANTILTALPIGNNYQWSNGSNSNSVTINSGGLITLTVTDNNGCVDDTIINIVQSNNPTPSIIGPANGCSGQNLVLDAGNYNAYQWSTGETTQTINITSSSTYSVIVTDINGCTGTDNFSITVNPKPTPAIIGVTSFCTGNQTTIGTSIPYNSYLWNNGEITQDINVITGGNYTVTVTDNNGCTESTSEIVTENFLPLAQISGTSTVCEGQPTLLTALPIGNNYLWSNGSISNTISPITSGIYTLTVYDANGCVKDTSIVFTVNLNPVITITGTDTICSGQPSNLQVPSIYANYLWSDGSTISQIQPISSGLITVSVTDNNGCIGTDDFQFTILNLPAVTVTGNLNFCNGDSTLLTATNSNYIYNWSNGAVNNTTYITNGGAYTLTVTDIYGCSNNVQTTVIENNLPQPILPATIDICFGQASILSPGNFNSYFWSDGSTGSTLTVGASNTYTVTVTDVNGCTNEIATDVTVHPTPTPTINGPTTTCENSPISLNVGAGYLTYQWSNGENGPTILTAIGGIYTVTVTDNYGCSNSANITLTVNPLADATISGDANVCEGEISTLATLPGQGTYLWSNGNTTTSINVNTTGIYSVLITTPQGCKSTGNFNFVSHLNPVINYNFTQILTCEYIQVQFNNSSIFDLGSTFSWNFGDGTTSIKQNPQHNYLLSGDYLTSLAIETPWGCKSSDTLTVSLTKPPAPIAKFSQSSEVASVFNSTVRFINESTNATRFKWSFDDGTSSEDLNPVHTFDRIGDLKIKLIAYNSANCFDEYETNLQIVPMFIPNGFTPNNDGKNDVFFDGTPVLNVQSYLMQVFDRWGKLLYVTNDFFKPWDGKFSNGVDAPTGVYYYDIRLVSEQGKDYNYKGTFSLIR